MSNKRFAALFGFAVVAGVCLAFGRQAAGQEWPGWKLVWSDEFDGPEIDRLEAYPTEHEAAVRLTFTPSLARRTAMHRSINSRLLSLAMLAVLPAVAAADDARYTLTPNEHGMVLKTPEGETVFAYMTRRPAETELTAHSVCCLYPVYTPAGVRAVDFAPDDHRHHRGIFFAWRATDFGGRPADFWGRGPEPLEEKRQIRNRAIKLVEAGADRAVVDVENDWTIAGDVVLDEQTRITASKQRGVYVLDFDYRLTPKVDMQLHHFAYTGFVVRARKDGQAAYFTPAGKVDLPSPHHLKPESNWPAAPWYNYVVELESGETVGTAVIDHPDNPPTTWHNVQAIALVNPCIVAPGPIERAAGETIRLRYRVVVHDGPADVEVLDELARAWREAGRAGLPR